MAGLSEQEQQSLGDIGKLTAIASIIATGGASTPAAAPVIAGEGFGAIGGAAGAGGLGTALSSGGASGALGQGGIAALGTGGSGAGYGSVAAMPTLGEAGTASTLEKALSTIDSIKKNPYVKGISLLNSLSAPGPAPLNGPRGGGGQTTPRRQIRKIF